VIVEVLSDHPGDQLRRVDAAREDQFRRVQEHRSTVNQLRAHHAASRHWWQIPTRLAQRGERRELERRAPTVDPGLDHQRAQHAAGVSAEEQMTAALHGLSDDWRLFRGYANGRGEVDHLLVGPGGVWAIEVKNRNARVHIDGDRWSYEKFDKYGNLVQQGPLVDRRGRSWGRQVSEIARELETFLARREHPVAVNTAVVLMHNRGSLGSHRDVQVSLFTVGTAALLERLHGDPPVLDQLTRDAVAKLVRHDHAHHAKRRARNRTPPA
jgi:hypothetical protein